MTTPAREPIRLLVFSASMRTGSLNTKLAELAVETIAANGGVADLASMEEFDSPSFDADDETKVGLPPGAQNLRDD
jgi:NAD(P)H-dependent FMN reductase